MDKEEILRKSRKSKTDEGIEFIQNKGIEFGFAIFIFVAFFMMIFNKFTGRESFDIFTLIFVFSSTETFSKYKFTRKKKYAVYTILNSIACILFFIAYIETSLR